MQIWIPLDVINVSLVNIEEVFFPQLEGLRIPSCQLFIKAGFHFAVTYHQEVAFQRMNEMKAIKWEIAYR